MKFRNQVWRMEGGVFRSVSRGFWGFRRMKIEARGRSCGMGWRLASLILVFLGAFGVTFVVSRNKAPVERTEAAMNGSYTASVTVTGGGNGSGAGGSSGEPGGAPDGGAGGSGGSSGGGAGDINLNVDATPEGTLVVAKQILQMTTNAPNGAEVYVSGGAETGMVLAGSGGSGSGSGSVGGGGSAGGTGGGGTPGGVPGSGGGSSSSDKLNRHTASVSSPAVLNVNTWGYAVPSDITGNGVSMAGFGEASAYQTAADNTNAGSVIGGGAGSLKFAGVRIADSGSPVTMEKIYAGATKNFPVYLGMLVGSNLAQGNYETNIYYTVIVEASDVAGGEITVEPGEVLPAGGETITVTSSLKSGTNNNSNVFGDATTVTASDVKVKIGGEDCTDVAVTSNAGENLKVTCKTPAKTTNKYDVTLEITKTGKTYTKPEGIEYKNRSPLESITYMQDMTWEICRDTPAPDSPTAPHIEKVLTDKRDNKTYRVVKAYDGGCWMAQNLRFNLTSGEALTPETSDVTSNWTPNHTTQTQGGTSGLPNWNVGYDAPRSHDTGNTEYGVYYNWNAATAGSGNSSTNTQGQNVPNSVCPKGWKLPRMDKNGNQNINDYEKMTVSYGGNYYTGNGSLGFSRLRSAPLSFPLPGFYTYGGSIRNQGSSGFFWSSTVYDSDKGFLLYLYSSNVNPRNADYRSYGWSVRCVVREPDITGATYMQDVTKEMCDNTKMPDSATASHVEKTLIDKRDNKTYRVVKAYDGKCWMTENLKLHLNSSTPLTPATSDVSSNWTPTHNTGTGSTGPTFSSDYHKEYSHDFATANYGVHYTWRAATAGKGNSSVTSDGQNVNDSICPKGWRLPRSGPNADANNDFYYLAERYGGTGSTGNSNLRNTNTLSFLLSGIYNYSNGQLYDASSGGCFWSSTVYDSDDAYNLNLNSSNVNPQAAYDRHHGFSVRCLVR